MNTDGYVVRAPHSTDPVGAALRNAFGMPAGLPCDWQRALDTLNRVA